MEAWEKSDRTLTTDQLLEIYREEFSKSISEQAEDTPNFNYWFGSGPYSGAEDIERRWSVGEKQLLDLIAYCEANPDEKPWITPEGEKAIELEFFVELGGVMVKGYIDQIVETPAGLTVRDIKTGSKPGDTFQLATYAEAVRIEHDEIPTGGDYLMGKTGKPTRRVEITEQDRERVHEAFATLDENIKAERFDPTPSRSVCQMCSVKTSCEFSAV